MARNQERKKGDAPAAEERTSESAAQTPRPETQERTAEPAARTRKTGATAWDWMIETGNDLEDVIKTVGWITAGLFLLGNKDAAEAVKDAFETGVTTLIDPDGEVGALADAIEPGVQRTARALRRQYVREERARRERNTFFGHLMSAAMPVSPLFKGAPAQRRRVRRNRINWGARLVQWLASIRRPQLRRGPRPAAHPAGGMMPPPPPGI